ncbi:hypothetical protein BKA65DRAFT_581153 [Rhexocercosporidium sp. MPI-PUGE-AT-0058]|nr:hypothetical protein BKA65DRAFT_581153 [Rhexocercosporidium sp. MPI-PUGE-AT-0058]
MRSNILVACVLLQARLSLAKPYLYAKNGMVYNVLPREGPLGENEAAIEARGMNLQQENVADTCLGSYDLIATGTGPSPTGRPRHRDPNFDFFEFCSSFIRPTKTYTVTVRTSTTPPPPPPVVTITVTSTRTSTKPPVVTVTVTEIRTSTSTTKPSTAPPPPPPTTKSDPPEPPVVTITVTASKTTTTKSTSKPATPTTSISSSSSASQLPSPPSTTTLPQPPVATGSLCPTAVSGQSCGVAGWGYAENNLYSGSPIDAASCHQLCLANPNCKSFQTQDSSYESPQCNLYKVDSSGNNTIPGAAPYLFYDRGCPDYAPATCTKVAPPATTAKPTLSVGFGHVERQWGRPQSQTLPWFLEPFGPVIISEVCSCIITLAPPAIGYTTTVGG